MYRVTEIAGQTTSSDAKNCVTVEPLSSCQIQAFNSSNFYFWICPLEFHNLLQLNLNVSMWFNCSIGFFFFGL